MTHIPTQIKLLTVSIRQTVALIHSVNQITDQQDLQSSLEGFLPGDPAVFIPILVVVSVPFSYQSYHSPNHA